MASSGGSGHGGKRINSGRKLKVEDRGEFALDKDSIFALDKLDLMQSICRILQLTDISIMAVERDKSRRE